MPKFNLTTLACLSAVLAAAPLSLPDATGLHMASAWAKEGKGERGGGKEKSEKSGRGEKSQGSGGNASGKDSAQQASSQGRSKGAGATRKSSEPLPEALAGLGETRPAGRKKQGLIDDTAVTSLDSVPKQKPSHRAMKAELGGLNSLGRNYHAYMNSSDPRMAAIRDYAMAYAAFELENGIDSIPSDPTLDDEALRAALAASARPGAVIDDATLEWAKSVLGVGSATRKIDEIREALAAAATPADVPEEATEEEVSDEVAEEGDDLPDQETPVEEVADEDAPAGGDEDVVVTPVDEEEGQVAELQ